MLILRKDGDIILLGKEEVSESQKFGYTNLVKWIIGDRYSSFKYIDIDGVEKAISSLSERDQIGIRMRMGFDGKLYTFKEIGKNLKTTGTNAEFVVKRALRKLKFIILHENYLGDIEKDKESLQKHEVEYDNIQERINALNIIKSLITDEHGNPKEIIEDIKLSEMGLSEKIFENGIIPYMTLQDLIDKKINLEEVEEMSYKEYMNKPIQYLGLSTREFNAIWGAGIKTVSDLLQKSEKEMKVIRRLGDKSRISIISKLQDMGLRLRYEDEETNALLGSHKITNNEDNGGKEIGISAFLERCNAQLQVYASNSEFIQEKINDYRSKIKNYGIVYGYYLQQKISEKAKKENLLRSIKTSQKKLRQLEEKLENAQDIPSQD